MYSNLYCGTLEIRTQADETENNDDIKLYQIELLKYQELVPNLISLLSETEFNRANGYHFEKDKNRFIICRALLKFFLAKHVGLEINKINLEVDSNKKPYLPNHSSVFFNISHSGDYGLIAIAKYPIGVDIECINKEFNYKEILQNVFNQNEIDAIENSNDKQQTFYKFWTRKEAIVKAIGKGIDEGFSEISVMDGFHSIKSSIVSNFENINVYSFDLNDNYVGALALTEVATNFDVIRFYSIPTPEELKELIS